MFYEHFILTGYKPFIDVHFLYLSSNVYNVPKENFDDHVIHFITDFLSVLKLNIFTQTFPS